MKRALFISTLLVFILAACQPAPVETEVPQVQETHTEEMPTQQAPVSGAVIYSLAAGESTLSYSVSETFINQNNKFNTAIGVTGSVSGEITLDAANPQNTSIGSIAAEIVEFESDSGRRDGIIRDRFLESTRFPTVTFVPTSITGLPESYTPGEMLTFQVTGDTTIRETTLPLTFDVTANLENDALSGQATTSFLMSDFGFGPISVAGILETEDTVLMTLNFVAYP